MPQCCRIVNTQAILVTIETGELVICIAVFLHDKSVYPNVERDCDEFIKYM